MSNPDVYALTRAQYIANVKSTVPESGRPDRYTPRSPMRLTRTVDTRDPFAWRFDVASPTAY